MVLGSVSRSIENRPALGVAPRAVHEQPHLIGHRRSFLHATGAARRPPPVRRAPADAYSTGISSYTAFRSIPWLLR
jgi:hypothetical protein